MKLFQHGSYFIQLEIHNFVLKHCFKHEKVYRIFFYQLGVIFVTHFYCIVLNLKITSLECFDFTPNRLNVIFYLCRTVQPVINSLPVFNISIIKLIRQAFKEFHNLFEINNNHVYSETTWKFIF